MKKNYFYLLVLIAVILAVMNTAIWQKEQMLAEGETVYLKLAPVDPRSLMQGDYMRLRYAIDNQLPRDRKINSDKVVIKTNAKAIAEFVRLDDGSPLAEGEKRFKLGQLRFWVGVKPNSFFFQEGHAKLYENAEYGIFIFAKNNPDSYLLQGLADKDLQEILPPVDK